MNDICDKSINLNLFSRMEQSCFCLYSLSRAIVRKDIFQHVRQVGFMLTEINVCFFLFSFALLSAQTLVRCSTGTGIVKTRPLFDEDNKHLDQTAVNICWTNLIVWFQSTENKTIKEWEKKMLTLFNIYNISSPNIPSWKMLYNNDVVQYNIPGLITLTSHDEELNELVIDLGIRQPWMSSQPNRTKFRVSPTTRRKSV